MAVITNGAAIVEPPVPAMSSSDFAREWAKAQQTVLAFIGSLTVDFSAADDLLQETAAQSFAQMKRYDPSRPFVPWVIGVARNVVLEHRRKMARDKHVFDQRVVAQLADAFEDLSEQDDAAYKALRICREQLSARSRYICRLRYERDLSPQQIAEQVDATPGMIRALLHRTRQQLRACIERRLRIEGALS